MSVSGCGCGSGCGSGSGCGGSSSGSGSGSSSSSGGDSTSNSSGGGGSNCGCGSSGSGGRSGSVCEVSKFIHSDFNQQYNIKMHTNKFSNIHLYATVESTTYVRPRERNIP